MYKGVKEAPFALTHTFLPLSNSHFSTQSPTRNSQRIVPTILHTPVAHRVAVRAIILPHGASRRPFQGPLRQITARCEFGLRRGDLLPGKGQVAREGADCPPVFRPALPFRQTAARREALEATGKGVRVRQGPISGNAAPGPLNNATVGQVPVRLFGEDGGNGAIRRHSGNGQRFPRNQAGGHKKNRPFFGSAIGDRGC